MEHVQKNGDSKLLKMKARFQQKQLAEREMKIASLYEAQQARALDRVRQSPSSTSTVASNAVRSPPSSVTAPLSTHVQPGKVRQMFEERRTKGIDKSYPLQPINNNVVGSRRQIPNGYSKVTNTTKVTVNEKNTRTRITNNSQSQSVKVKHKVDNVLNGAGDLNHNHQTDYHSVQKTVTRKSGDLPDGYDEVDNYMLEDETFPEALAPLPTPRSTATSPISRKLAPKKTPAIKNPAVASQKIQNNLPRRTASDNPITVGDTNKPRGGMQRLQNPVPRKSEPRGPSGSTGRVIRGRTNTAAVADHSSASAESAGATPIGPACTVCGRRFNPDRIQHHEEICKKANAKKRKPFDVLKHRLAGTEAEPFINKLRKSVINPPKQKSLNNNWKQKHEEFISAIRAAKEVQAHINAGGKLSDLPPPPPSENPDYVKCPHCGRRFNQSAAERHIPKCNNYQYNKPKPQASRKR